MALGSWGPVVRPQPCRSLSMGILMAPLEEGGAGELLAGWKRGGQRGRTH